jgi:hypothetical protein
VRFRVYRAPDHLARYLADLRQRNRELETRVEGLADAARELQPRPPSRDLEVVPASADD